MILTLKFGLEIFCQIHQAYEKIYLLCKVNMHCVKTWSLISAYVPEWWIITRLQAWRTTHSTEGYSALHHLQNNLGLDYFVPDTLHHNLRAFPCLLWVRTYSRVYHWPACWLAVSSWYCFELSHHLCGERWRGHRWPKDDTMELYAELVLFGLSLLAALWRPSIYN